MDIVKLFTSFIRRVHRRIRQYIYGVPYIYIPQAVYRSTTVDIDISYRQWCQYHNADEAYEMIPI